MANRWKQFLFWFSASTFGSWFMKRFMEPIDPVIYRLTGGRATSAGPVVIPQLYDIYKTRTDRNIKVYRMDEAG